MSSFQTLLAVIIAAALALLYVKQLRDARRQRTASGEKLFADLELLLESAERQMGESIGSWKLSGRYRGEFFQFITIVDTLSLRKLPVLWFMVTLPKPQPVAITVDMMMRPAGPTTFSKFDFLPHTVPTPADFPLEAVIRTDETATTLPVDEMKAVLDLFRDAKGKELLISPKGLRIVVQLAQGDRLRYGVFREARFEEERLDAALATRIMNALLQLDTELGKRHAGL